MSDKKNVSFCAHLQRASDPDESGRRKIILGSKYLSVGPGSVVEAEVNETEKSSSSGKKFRGFHLTRSKWDPYPWIGFVEIGSDAETSGLRAGDCLLCVDGVDVLELPMSEIASLIERNYQVELQVWRGRNSTFSGHGVNCKFDYDQDESMNNNIVNDEKKEKYSKCSGILALEGPLPEIAIKLTRAVSNIVRILECPVCLESAAPPVSQCVHGHILCVDCRSKSTRCPICRVTLGQGRCLLADKCHKVLVEALIAARDNKATSPANHDGNRLSLRDKLFGSRIIKQTIKQHRLREKEKEEEEEEEKEDEGKNEKEEEGAIAAAAAATTTTTTTTSIGMRDRSTSRKTKNLISRIFPSIRLDEKAVSTESLPAAATNYIHSNLSSPTSLSSLSAERQRGRWLLSRRADQEECLNLYDRTKSASTGELSRGKSDKDVDVPASGSLQQLASTTTTTTTITNDHVLNHSSNYLRVPSQTPSWGGSIESIQTSNQLTCPVWKKTGCDEILSSDTILEHLSSSHSGPIIHFYQGEATLPIPWPFFPTGIYILHRERELFFLQLEDNNVIWVAGTESSDKWNWILYVYDDTGREEETFHRNVISLQELSLSLPKKHAVVSLSKNSSAKTLLVRLIYNPNSMRL